MTEALKIARDYQERILSYTAIGDYVGAIKVCLEAIEESKKTDNYDLRKMSYLQCGVAYYYVGQYSVALEYMDAYRKLLKQHGSDQDYLNYYNFVFALYEKVKDYDQAKRSLIQAIHISKALNKLNMLSSAYSNYAHLLIKQGYFEEALTYARMAVETGRVFVPYQAMLVIRGQLNLCLAYLKLKRLEEAYSLLVSLNSAHILEHHESESLFVYDLYGQYFEALKDYDHAVLYFKKALAKADCMNDAYLRKDALEGLVRIFELDGNLAEAFAYQKKLIHCIELINELDFEQMSLTMKMGIELEETKDAMMRDSLTGIYNRRFLEHYASTYLHKASLVCILFDLDDFKSVNDCYGHIVGDHILKKVTLMVQERLRAEDHFIRYGGDEFLLVLEDVTLEQGKKLCERVLETVSQTPIKVGQHTIKITLSMGVTDHLLNEPVSFMDIIHNADVSLYKAKANGKNRVEMAYDCMSTQV